LHNPGEGSQYPVISGKKLFTLEISDEVRLFEIKNQAMDKLKRNLAECRKNYNGLF